MRILLADDHAIVRAGLRHIVEEAFPTAFVGEASSCDEVVAAVADTSWSVLVLDVALGDRNGLTVLPEVRRIAPGTRIVVLSMYGERQFVVRALRAGALAYLTKDRAPEELLQAIRAVLEGRRFLGQSVALELAEHVSLAGDGGEEPHAALSSREHEVFLLLASARSVSEIATQLGLSVKTVSTYRSRILEKMGMKTNAELMRYALQRNLVR